MQRVLRTRPPGNDQPDQGPLITATLHEGALLSVIVDSAAAPNLSAAPGDFHLGVTADVRLGLARGWLWLGLLSLIGSGVLAILLVVSRTPGVGAMVPVADFFHVALVVHVDLSVLVWFVSIAGLLWSLAGGSGALAAARAGLALCSIGTALMATAPFIGHGAPIMANYIPVLADPVFLAGLVAFGGGSAVLVGRALLVAPLLSRPLDGGGALRLGLTLAAVTTAVALAAFAASWWLTPDSLSGKAYYEILFWGGGHVLQFVWTLLMLVAWLWLAQACGQRVSMSPRIAAGLFVCAAAGVVAVPIAYALYDVHSVEHRQWLTLAMALGGGLPILPVALAAMRAVATATAVAPAARPLRASLYSSLLLFCVGGLIGFAIAGTNVKIPAHYHGVIVGVTLALMGLVYHLLPQLGYATPTGKLATAQPYVYAMGQLMHIGGLVWSGGYGVQRKVAGTDQILRSTQEVIAMGIMGLGGLIAIIGGLLFVVVVGAAMLKRRPR